MRKLLAVEQTLLYENEQKRKGKHLMETTKLCEKSKQWQWQSGPFIQMQIWVVYMFISDSSDLACVAWKV